MITVAMVYGIGFSGSTVLGMAMSALPRAAVLGEVGTYLGGAELSVYKRKHPLPCACSKEEEDCEFWGGASRRLRQLLPDTPLREKYKVVLEEFGKTFGADAILVDTSKSSIVLAMLAERTDIRLRVIYLTRDIRAWTCSSRDRVRAQKMFDLSDIMAKKGAFRAPAWYLKRTPLGCAAYWCLRNMQFRKFLKSMKIEYVTISYEEFVLNQNQIFTLIAEFLGTDETNLQSATAAMSAMKGMKNHVIRGNGMRYDPEKNKKLSYDYRWFMRSDWYGYYLPFVARYNRNLVYSHSNADYVQSKIVVDIFNRKKN